jgi:hypothetical protein
MNYRSKATLSGALWLAAFFLCTAIFLSASRLLAEVPLVIAVLGEVPATSFHAEGAQIYRCESVSRSKLEWQPREPIATLILDGNTVGRHYAGLHWDHVDGSIFRWEHNDGSAVQAKVAASVSGATPDDMPWLRLDVTSQNHNGTLYGVTTVQRINTRGGMIRGSCDRAGEYLSVPYSADYVFWRED